MPMFSHTGAEMAEIPLQFSNELGINIKACRGQSCDDSANMSGKYHGLQTLIRENAEVLPIYLVQCILSI